MSELQGRHSVITASVIVVIGLSSLNVAVVLRLRFGCLLECAHLKWCYSPIVACGVNTEQGVPKPLYLNASMASGRWDAFKDKILHVIGDVEVLGGAPRESAMAPMMAGQRASGASRATCQCGRRVAPRALGPAPGGLRHFAGPSRGTSTQQPIHHGHPERRGRDDDGSCGTAHYPV